MLSSISTTKSVCIQRNNIVPVALQTSFSAFPTSIIGRYDMFYESGRFLSTGVNVTTNNQHVYKIVNKENIGMYDLISRSTEANKVNYFSSAGMGINKPCVIMNGSVISNIGYQTLNNHPNFPNGFEMICVMRPLGNATYNKQNFLTKTGTSSANIANPFDIQGGGNVAGSGSNPGFVVIPHHASVSFITTPTTGFIFGVNMTKATGKCQEFKNGLMVSDVTNNLITSYYSDNTNMTMLVGAKRDNTNNCKFEWGEILLFTSALSISDRNMIEGYLSSKWGIPLDASHPYYNTTVTYTGTNP